MRLWEKLIVLIIIISVIVAGIYFLMLMKKARVKIGDKIIRVNPKVSIDSDKQYALTYWDYDLPITNGQVTYKDYIRTAVKKFQQKYPNIKINYRLLDPFDGPAEFQSALEKGNPPDVYSAPFAATSFLFKYQIPLDPYLASHEKERYYPIAVQQASTDGVLCAFPRWINVSVWAGNKALLAKSGVNIGKIQLYGWTWDDFLASARKLGEGEKALVGNRCDDGLLYHLMLASGMERIFVNGKLQLTGEKLTQFIALVEGLKKNKKLSSDYSSNMLGELMDGKAMALGGIRPWLKVVLEDRMNKAKERGLNIDGGSNVVYLPPPSIISGQERVPVTTTLLSVYRQDDYKGDDNTRAAVEFARFMSNYSELWVHKRAGVFPASKDLEGTWKESSGLQREENEMFCRLIREKTVNPLDSEERSYILKVVQPAVVDYLKGKIDIKQLESELQQVKVFAD